MVAPFSSTSILIPAEIMSGGSWHGLPTHSLLRQPSSLAAHHAVAGEFHLTLKSDASLLCSKPPLTSFPHSVVLSVMPGPYATWPLASPPSAPSPFTSSVQAPPFSLLLLEPTRHALTSRPSHCLFPLPGMLFLQANTWPTLTSLLSLFKFHSSGRPP